MELHPKDYWDRIFDLTYNTDHSTKLHTFFSRILNESSDSSYYFVIYISKDSQEFILAIFL